MIAVSGWLTGATGATGATGSMHRFFTHFETIQQRHRIIGAVAKAIINILGSVMVLSLVVLFSESYLRFILQKVASFYS